MGIPRLMTHLRSWARLETVDGSANEPRPDEEQTWRRRAIIDGPALAYHVYYAYLARPGGAASPPTTAPSCSPYRDLGRAVVAWLDRLRSCGLTIERLYFDGALPPGKETTRRARLQQSLQQLISFRSLHPTLAATALWRCPASLTSRAELDPGTVHAGGARPGRATAPAPVFLVAAVLEALSASAHYGPLTEVVPGEADAFCAAHARRAGGLILTNDSDLLVYDSGPKASVTFLSESDFSVVTSAGDSFGDPATRTCAFRYLSYEPARMMREMGLPEHVGLAAFAFEVERDAAIGIPQLLQRARDQSSKVAFEADFRAFLDRYQIPEEVTPLHVAQLDCENRELHGLTFLEPRVSELVHRIRLACSETSHDASAQEGLKDVSMHLPFLLDDPTRSTAWQIGLSQRTLAYSLLGRTLPPSRRRSHLSELGRRGQRIAAVEVLLLDPDAIVGAAKNLCRRYQTLQNTLPGASAISLWTIFAVQDIMQTAMDNEKAPPTRAQLLLILQSESPTPDWSIVHLFAQMQAGLYSLHMLRQVLRVVSGSAHTGELPVIMEASPFGMLERILHSLPTLTEGLPNKPDGRPESGKPEPRREDIVDWLLQSMQEPKDLGLEHQEPDASSPTEWRIQQSYEKNNTAKSSGRKKTKKKGKTENPNRQPLGSRAALSSSNVFHALADIS